MSTSIDRIARDLLQLRRDVRKIQTQPQLGFSSVEGGYLLWNDYLGNPAVVVGEQFDGTNAASILTGPPPPTPTTPSAIPTYFAATVSWDGLFLDDALVPMDFSRVEIHAVEDPDDPAETSLTLVGTYETSRGGDALVPLPGPRYIKLVTRSLPGGRSTASAATGLITPIAAIDTTAIQAELDELNDVTLPGVLATVSDVQTTVDTLNDTTIPAITLSLSDAQTAIDTLNDTTIPGITTALTAAQADIDTINDTTIPGITTSLTAAQADIDTLNDTTIPALNGALSDAQDDIDTINDTTIPGISIDITALEGRFPVQTVDLAANAVTGTIIADNSVTSAKIVANTITANDIAALTITAAEIAANTITAAKIAANTITASQIAALTITSAQIAASTITASKILLTDLSNLVEDGGFENGAPGFTGAGAVATISDPVNGGTKVWRHASTGALVSTNYDPRGTQLVFDVVPGESYYFSVNVRKTTTGTTGSIQFDAWFTLDGLSASTTHVPGSPKALSGMTQNVWTSMSGIVTIPASKNKMMPQIHTLASVPSGQTIEWDNLVIRKAMNASLVVDGSITTNSMTSASINGDRITTNTLNADRIVANSITAAKIAADTITAAEIAANAITTSELNALAVTAAKIAANTITAGQIAALTITAAEIAANTITAAKIVADTITANEIAANAISTSELNALAVTAAKIAANTITASQIAATTITGDRLVANTITAGQIAALTITANEIAANTITAAKIAAGTITATEIAANTITTAKLSATAIDGMTVSGATVTGGIINSGTDNKVQITTVANPFQAGSNWGVIQFFADANSGYWPAQIWSNFGSSIQTLSLTSPYTTLTGPTSSARLNLSTDASSNTTAELVALKLKFSGASVVLNSTDSSQYNFDVFGTNVVSFRQSVGTQRINLQLADAIGTVSLNARNVTSLGVGTDIRMAINADDILLDVTSGALLVGGGTNIQARLEGNAGGASVNFTSSSVIIGNAGFNASSPGSGNTQTFHAKDIHSWSNGVTDEALSGGGVTGANIGNGGRIVRTSTEKMKTAIKPMTVDEAHSVLNLESYTGRFKKDSIASPDDPRRYPFFIAEQGAEAGAELWVGRQHKVEYDDDGKRTITRDKNGEIIYFRTADITVAHNYLIKELRSEVDTLKQQVAELRALVVK